MAMSTLPEKFHPHQLFVFPKRKFGSKGEERTFRADWCQQYPWLHYVIQDAAFCYLCMTAEHQKKFLASRKRHPAFITKGFTYWKEATSAFKKYQSTDCHREATQVVIFQPKEIRPIDEMLNEQHKTEKATNRRMFLRILHNLRFLTR